MAKVTAKYETMFIINPNLSEEATAALVAKFKALTDEYATPDTVEVKEWGKRHMEYEIQDFKEGYYVLINFESKPDYPAELDRVYKITDGILRSLIICVDEK